MRARNRQKAKSKAELKDKGKEMKSRYVYKEGMSKKLKQK